MMEVIVVFVILVGGLRPASGEEHKGVKGGVVVIQCTHSYAQRNVKYFCREPCMDSDVLVTSQNTGRGGRYSIKDDGNIFSVTISNLEISDTGAYRCGINRIGFDTFQRVVINVTEDSQHEVRPIDLFESFAMDANDGMGPISNRKLLYVGTSLGLVILALIVILLIFFRHRRIRRHSTTCGNATDSARTAPLCREDDTRSSVTPSSCQTASLCEGADDEETRGGGRVDTIYCNTDGPVAPRAQLEDLCYSTVSFTALPSERPVASSPESYSIIRYLPQDKSSVYSNV